MPVELTECPQCAGSLVSERSAIRWCANCDWNLDSFDPPPTEEKVRRLVRWNHRTAFRLNRELFAALAGAAPGSRGRSWAGVALAAASAVLLAATIGLAVLGVALIGYHFPNIVTVLPGVGLIGLAVLLRPRLGRFTGDYNAVTRAEAPTLFALVERVAAHLGAPVPSIITVSAEFNAAAAVYGLRRRTVLQLGMPLWGVLGPQQRVALLGHELGHFVNGDPTRRLLTQPAFRTLGALASVFAPEGMRGRTMTERLGLLVFRPLFWLLSRAALAGQLGLLWIGMREHQRAEYAADAVSVRAAGTEAAVALLDDLVLDTSITLAIRTTEITAQSLRATKSGVAAAWRRAAQRVRDEQADRLPVLRQHAIRAEADLLASHPPTGLRARMVESWPAQHAAIELTEADSDRIDAELAKRYLRAGRDLAHSRS